MVRACSIKCTYIKVYRRNYEFFALQILTHISFICLLKFRHYEEATKFWKIRPIFLTLKFICYSEKVTKFCEISTLLLSYVVPVKSKVEISKNFVAFSEHLNFTRYIMSNILGDHFHIFFAFSQNLDCILFEEMCWFFW